MHIIKEANLKRLYTIQCQLHDILQRLNYGHCEKVRSWQDWEQDGGMNRQSTEDFFGHETILCDATLWDSCHQIAFKSDGIYNT